MKNNYFWIIILLFISIFTPLYGETKSSNETLSKEPYIGAIVINASTGEVLFEENADAKGYPASVLKLMSLLIILEKIKEGVLKWEDQINITAEAAKIGGSQVYLKENEVFTLDELLYAMMVQSANDAVTAIAIYIAGSKGAFVEWMNQKAKALGMNASQFHSIHGLPPGVGQLPDVTTARDLSILARELLKYPDTLRYSSVRERGFRNGTFMMRNHNHLLWKFDGCDGMKTGYYKKAGYSIIATAKRHDFRVIAVILGCKSKKGRDDKASELLSKGFLHHIRK
ncbi:MAG: D-alanyl-D-alanine carboxypeptidase [Candidatus Aureabacteria bacterium]|nr:D-alanyl-D-alanine carboxypeptidase [Candidatus Auribacterota bacterium]